MGASDVTDFLGLPLFGDNDKPTWRGDVNGAFRDIDDSVKSVSGVGTDNTAFLSRLALLSRIDRQNANAARVGGGKAHAAYADATEFDEAWNDLTQWSTSNLQVSGNRLYFLTGSQASAIKSFPVAANEVAHVRGTFTWKAGGASNPIYFGIDLGAAGHVPVASSPDMLAIGINSSGQRSVFNGGTAGTTVTGLNLIGNNPTVDTTYAFSIDVGENFISYSMHPLGASDTYSTAYVGRYTIPAGKAVNNVSLYNGDTRALNGHSFGPIAMIKARQPVRNRTNAFYAVDATEHRDAVTAPVAAGDPWRYSIPASYDPRIPAPVVMYFHQSLTGSQHGPWLESRMQPVTKALSDAGYIVAAALDTGDRWGNQASLDAYLSLYTHLRDRFNTGPVYFLGISMGGLVALNALTHDGWPTPAAVATVGGVVDLNTLWKNNTGAYAPGIRAAYGIAADGSDYAARTAGFNAAQRKGREFRSVPLRLYTSPGDTEVPKTTNQDVLTSLVSGYAPEAVEVVGSGGHLDPSQFQAADLVAFFGRYR